MGTDLPGLSRALPSELRLRAATDDDKLLGTTNDEQNAAMRGINRKMGYTPEAPTTVYEKRFA